LAAPAMCSLLAARRLLGALGRRAHTPPLRGLSTQVNPLLGIEVATTKKPSSAVSAFWHADTVLGPKPLRHHEVAVAHYRQIRTSPRKLRTVARLVPGLFWREAMLQMEFCRKNMAAVVKNAIESAVNNAKVKHGWDVNRLIVDECYVTKGSYGRKIDFKAKGQAGMMKQYYAHLRVTVRQVSIEELEVTKGYARWKKASQILELPWEERIKQLPRYKPIPGYDPGRRRIPILPLIPERTAG